MLSVAKSTLAVPKTLANSSLSRAIPASDGACPGSNSTIKSTSLCGVTVPRAAEPNNDNRRTLYFRQSAANSLWEMASMRGDIKRRFEKRKNDLLRICRNPLEADRLAPESPANTRRWRCPGFLASFANQYFRRVGYCAGVVVLSFTNGNDTTNRAPSGSLSGIAPISPP